MKASVTSDLSCAADGIRHPSESHKAGCPICNPTKTVPQLNDAYRASNERVDQRLRSKIGGFLLEPDTNDGGDTLAIALCSYFERHMNRPRPDPDTENGWGQWAEEKTNAALDALTRVLMPQVRDDSEPTRPAHREGTR
jgi:hypothetical protein